MENISKEVLLSALTIIKSEVSKIKKQYVCGRGEHGDGLTANEGFDELVSRIERKVKKHEK